MCERHNERKLYLGILPNLTAEEMLSQLHQYASYEKIRPTLYCPVGGLTVMETWWENGKLYKMCPSCGMKFGEIKRKKKEAQ